MSFIVLDMRLLLILAVLTANAFGKE